jgi:hypothetical protein
LEFTGIPLPPWGGGGENISRQCHSG